MLSLDKHIKGCLDNYFIFHRTQDLVLLFNELIVYSDIVFKEIPELFIVDMFKESYQLDDMDLKLAYKEFLENESVASIKNMLFVICMVYKGFGRDLIDFKKEFEELLDKQFSV